MQKHLPTPSKPNLITRGLKLSHLRLLVALARTGQISEAAAELGLTQPAASRLAAEISRVAGHQIHRRTGKGIALTAMGEVLAERARGALIEIGEAARDLDEGAAGRAGIVRVGAVTGASFEHLLPALRAIRNLAPQVQVHVEVAPSDHLGELLLEGKLDFTLSRYPNGRSAALFSGTPLGTEPISVIVRRGHPLLARAPVSLAETLRYDWVLPDQNALLRQTVLQVMLEAGLPEPNAAVVTSSFLFTLGVVTESDALAPIAASVARSQIGQGAATGRVCVLPLKTPIEVDSYMLLTRKGQLLTPSAQIMVNLIRERAAEGRSGERRS